jgi:hypothetical protein
LTFTGAPAGEYGPRGVSECHSDIGPRGLIGASERMLRVTAQPALTASQCLVLKTDGLVVMGRRRLHRSAAGAVGAGPTATHRGTGLPV